MSRMKAVVAERTGGPEVLAFTEVEIPRPGPGEVLIRIHASGVNYADIMCRAGAHPGMPRPPLIVGCEASGSVEQAGTGASRYRPGERVAVYSPVGGSYAEWIVAPETHVLPLPPSMSFDEGAAFTHVFLTSYHALRTLAHARRGDWIVVTAAAGGVGTAIVQLARCWGFHVIAGAGSATKLEVLRALGVEHTVNYRETSLAAFASDVTAGHGADVVLESVGGEIFADALRCLAPLGRLVLFGIASGKPAAVHPFDLLKTSSTFATLNLSVIFAHHPDVIQESWQELLTLHEAGNVRPVITRRFGLHEAARAHALVEARATVGKLVLNCERLHG